MTHSIKLILSMLAVSGAFVMASSPAHAQSSEEVVGAVIGGTAGAAVGGEIDKDGSNTEGVVIGAIVGGTLGYAVGDAIDDDNDRRTDRRYDDRRLKYHKDQYRNDGYRNDGKIYYDRRVTTKSHPVHGTNPGRGHDKKHKKDRR